MERRKNMDAEILKAFDRPRRIDRTTSHGCRAQTTLEYNRSTDRIDETIVLSHPRSITEVAFGADAVLERANRR